MYYGHLTGRWNYGPNFLLQTSPATIQIAVLAVLLMQEATRH